MQFQFSQQFSLFILLPFFYLPIYLVLPCKPDKNITCLQPLHQKTNKQIPVQILYNEASNSLAFEIRDQFSTISIFTWCHPNFNQLEQVCQDLLPDFLQDNIIKANRIQMIHSILEQAVSYREAV